MQIELLDILRCPRTGQRLTLDKPVYQGGRISAGWLVTSHGEYRYPIRDFIPRFVAESNYADSFGMQWNRFRRTQLDSHSGHPISARRFWGATGWQPEELAGQWVLDAGCGAGRFADVSVQSGAKVVALDYSGAVDACIENLRQHPNLHVVQGDIYALPFPSNVFSYVYSLGVLQHTPDVAAAFAALPRVLISNGKICADFYWKRLRTMLHGKYLLRPFTSRMAPIRLLANLEAIVPTLLSVSHLLGRTPVLGKALARLIPIADYKGVYPLSDEQLKEWAILDTFDMLAPRYDNPQTSTKVEDWFLQAGLVDVEILHVGHLVGRGRKPA